MTAPISRPMVFECLNAGVAGRAGAHALPRGGRLHEERAAAIADGSRARARLAGRASADLHCGHEREGQRPHRRALSRCSRPDAAGSSPITAWPARRYVMLDLRRRGGDVRGFVRDLEEWLIRALARFNVKGETPRRPRRHLGRAREPRGQDRRDRRARAQMGDVPRRLAQRRSRPRPFRRHRALRHKRARRHQPGTTSACR